MHDWCLSIQEAKSVQEQLSKLVSCRNTQTQEPVYIAGTDIWTSRTSSEGRAAVVVLKFPELCVVETAIEERELAFPYVPGYLSFREAPLILAAFSKLALVPDLVIADGQGIAHPRRLGLASHLGLHLGIPTIGCAKSRLCGSFEPVGIEPGSYSLLSDDREVIGAVVRTKRNVKPVFISIGHNIDLTTAIRRIMQYTKGYRLPEPSRIAHLSAGGRLVT